MQPCEQSSNPNVQYKTDADLSSRINLHQLFSRNPYGWFKWVFDQLDVPPRAAILEIACGRGDLWAENLDRIPAGWDITLTDASTGMLDAARQRLASSPHPFVFEHADIQSIPFEAARFDAVIANHMLYYVRDKARAFHQVLRVLKPGGLFFTTTVGGQHLHELVQLTGEFLEGRMASDLDSGELDFLLENGASQLAPFFGSVETRRYVDSLFITQAEPLVEYIFSGGMAVAGLGSSVKISRHDFHAFIEQKIREKGGIYVLKDSGIFIARKGG